MLNHVASCVVKPYSWGGGGLDDFPTASQRLCSVERRASPCLLPDTQQDMSICVLMRNRSGRGRGGRRGAIHARLWSPPFLASDSATRLQSVGGPHKPHTLFLTNILENKVPINSPTTRLLHPLRYSVVGKGRKYTQKKKRTQSGQACLMHTFAPSYSTTYGSRVLYAKIEKIDKKNNTYSTVRVQTALAFSNLPAALLRTQPTITLKSKVPLAGRGTIHPTGGKRPPRLTPGETQKNNTKNTTLY